MLRCYHGCCQLWASHDRSQLTSGVWREVDNGCGCGSEGGSRLHKRKGTSAMLTSRVKKGEAVKVVSTHVPVR